MLGPIVFNKNFPIVHFLFSRYLGNFCNIFLSFWFLKKRQTDNLMRSKISKIQGEWRILFLSISKTFCLISRQNCWIKIVPLFFLKVSGKFVQKILTKFVFFYAKFWFKIEKNWKFFTFFDSIFIIFFNKMKEFFWFLPIFCMPWYGSFTVRIMRKMEKNDRVDPMIFE